MEIKTPIVSLIAYMMFYRETTIQIECSLNYLLFKTTFITYPWLPPLYTWIYNPNKYACVISFPCRGISMIRVLATFMNILQFM